MGDILVFSGLTIHRSIPQVKSFARVSTQFRLGNFHNIDAIKRGWPVGQLEGRSFNIDHPDYTDNLKTFYSKRIKTFFSKRLVK